VRHWPLGPLLASGEKEGEKESSMLFVGLFVCISKFWTRSERVGAKVASAPSVPGTCSDALHRMPPLSRAAGMLPAHTRHISFHDAGSASECASDAVCGGGAAGGGGRAHRAWHMVKR
jgi:hypothetical protein